MQGDVAATFLSPMIALTVDGCSLCHASCPYAEWVKSQQERIVALFLMAATFDVISVLQPKEIFRNFAAVWSKRTT